jgi:hypothetical protein
LRRNEASWGLVVAAGEGISELATDGVLEFHASEKLELKRIDLVL